MSSSFFLIVSLFFGFSQALMSADKIGNGGGVWACQASDQTIMDLMFIDIYEARREFLLTVPEITGTYLASVQDQKAWVRNKMPQLADLIPHIEYVEKNITWIEEVLTDIPDVSNKVSPHPSTCKGGSWKTLQMVNFTDDFRILVRRELFDSSMLTEMERAAVYLHEGVYSYMRTEYGDKNSVRTRKIVGILFSDLPDSEKKKRIEMTLKDDNSAVVTPPTMGWICGLRPNSSSFYTAEAMSKENATKAVVEACKKGQNPFGFGGSGNNDGGFPFPPIPGNEDGSSQLPFPMPPMGFGFECRENQVACEEITTSEKNKKCEKMDFFEKMTFTGYGKTFLEAQKEAVNQCLIQSGTDSYCFSTDKMVCK